MLNRSLLIVRAKEPFVKWINGLPDPLTPTETLETVNEDSSAYLLPEYDDDEERDAILEEVFEIIFRDLLNAWWTDDRAWPQKRTLPLFRSWFELDWHSIIDDLVDGPLIDEG